MTCRLHLPAAACPLPPAPAVCTCRLHLPPAPASCVLPAASCSLPHGKEEGRSPENLFQNDHPF